MPPTCQPLRPGAPLEIFLDGQAVDLPAGTRQSWPAIRAQLELMALREGRVLADFHVQEAPEPGAGQTAAGACQVQAATISLAQVAREISRRARRQCDRLLARAGEAGVLVLINEWPEAGRLAAQVQIELRDFLTRIIFLGELCDGVLLTSGAGQRPFAGRMEEYLAIQRQFQSAESERDVIQLSGRSNNWAPGCSNGRITCMNCTSDRGRLTRGTTPARVRLGRAVGGLLAALLLIAGCKTRPVSDMVFGPLYKPTNVSRAVDRLPPDIRRVAVIPLTAATAGETILAGRDSLEPILQLELSKTRTCEWLIVSREQLRVWTGQAEWSSQDSLPTNFFPVLREKLGCDAVLFSQLTQYRPYKPIAIGWRLDLVECHDAMRLWSLDETYDAGTEPVSNAARRYAQDQVQIAARQPDSTMILISPAQFGQFTLASSLATLPGR